MINWQHKTFKQLSVDDLFDILQLRQEVFIIEQQCIYPDIDSIDKTASHLFARTSEDQYVSAYLRIVPPGVKFTEVSLGRVLTSKLSRGTGIGRALMEEAIRVVNLVYPGLAIRIAAQAYLERFYFELGFKTVSKPYDEDGIAHIDMLYELV